METKVDQIAERIYRLSTCIPEVAPGGFTFNQFLIDADEPLLYHTGMRALFPSVRAAVERVMPVERLRWIAFAHVEADECGAVNEFLAVAPQAQVAHGALGCMLSLDDQCLRPPQTTGRRRVPGHRWSIAGPARPRGGHPTRTTQLGIAHVLRTGIRHVVLWRPAHTNRRWTGDHRVGPFGRRHRSGGVVSPDFPWTGGAGPYRRLAALQPRRLAIMHGSSFSGDCARLLRSMADVYEQRFGCASGTVETQSLPSHGAPDVAATTA